MKKLWLVFIIALLLSACNETNTLFDSSASEAPSSVHQGFSAQNSDSQSSETQSSVTQNSDTIHSYHTVLDQSKNKGHLPPFDDSALYKIDTYLQTLETDSFIAQEDIAFLKSVGIDVNIYDIEKIDNDSFEFSLNIKNKYDEMSHKLIATLAFNNHGTAKDVIPENFSFYWGTLAYTDNVLTITATDKIFVYDNPTQNFNYTQITPKFAQDFGPYYLAFAMPQGGNYVAMMYEFEQTANILFDKDGNVLSTQVFEFNYFQDNYIVNSATKYRCQTYTMPVEVSSGKYHICHFYNYYKDEQRVHKITEGFIYDTNSNTFGEGYINLSHFTDDNFRIVFFSQDYNTNFTANIYKNNNIIEQHSFASDLLHYSFPYAPSGDDEQHIINYENNVLTMSNPFSKCTLEIDFNNNSENITFDYTEEDLNHEHMVQYSQDGRYSIHSVYSYGGGDIFYDYKAVFDSITGKVTFIDLSGGMYGGGSSISFLPNNDIYSISYEKYKIFSEKNDFAETISLKESLNLGANSADDTNRILFAVWRNPKNFELVAIYSDIFLEELRHPRTDDKTHLVATYKIALLSENGELIDSYNTGQYVRYPGMSYDTVSIEPSKDSFTIYTSWASDISLLGTFNMNTKTFTANG